MAYELNIEPPLNKVFFDTDNLLRYTVYKGEPTLQEILAGTAIPEDVTGWDIGWVMRKKAAKDPILITKRVGSGIAIVGVYDPDPAVNTQRVEVTIEDTDTYDPSGSPVVNIKAAKYFYALKRLDPRAEKMLAYGSLKLLIAAAWE